MSKSTSVKLFVEFKDRSIVDEERRPVSLHKARELWEAGKVSDFNLAFQRLATGALWDFDELERQYAAMDRARGIQAGG